MGVNTKETIIILINSVEFEYADATAIGDKVKQYQYVSTYINYTLVKGKTELSGTYKTDHPIAGYTVSQLAELVQKELERNQVI